MKETSGAAAADRPKDLGEACVREALAIIDREGIEALSLRAVARRLGVSHQAPYRHYRSRDHLLAEVVRRAFESFAAHLDARERHAEPAADLAAMGFAYLDYAAHHPLQYRLMFGTPLPEACDHPGMMDKGRYAFGLLEAAIRALDSARPKAARIADPRLDALHVWAQLHGLATIAQSSALQSLGHPEIKDVRQGKLFEVELDNLSPAEAREKLEGLSKEVLANPVIEQFQVFVDD